MEHLRGKFIVLDGPEGCGKTTQARLLQNWVDRQGLSALLVRDPGTTRVGEQVRALLLDPANSELTMRCEMLLYMAARAQMVSQFILPALERGQVVVADRFISSTLAYQLGGEGLTGAQIRAVGDVAAQGRWPDLTIVLDIAPQRSFERMAAREKDRIERRPPEYHQQVHANYLRLAQEDPLRYRVVAAEQSIEAVHAQIASLVQTALQP